MPRNSNEDLEDITMEFKTGTKLSQRAISMAMARN